MTACLDPGPEGRAVGRFSCVLVGACLLALGLACAPRPAHRAVEHGDAGEDGGSGGAGPGGSGGLPGPDAASATGGSVGLLPDALAPDAPPVLPDGGQDLARDTAVPDLAADVLAPADARDGGVSDLPLGVDLTVGLVHHWKFDEGTGLMAADSAGKANTGTLSGGGLPDWTTGGAPLPGNVASLTFDGVDDYVGLKDGLAPVLGGTATLSCWIKTTQTGNNNSYDAPGITGVEQGGGSNDIFWGFIDGSGYIGLRPGSGRTVKSTGPINDDKWHHVVMTRDETSGRIQIFVDGALAKADDGMQTGAKSTPFSALGRITDSARPYFKGQLDDVRIWSRVLTPAEVAALYAGN